ncbi:hypothetical protein ACET3Z_005601 [Daucus carota]
MSLQNKKESLEEENAVHETLRSSDSYLESEIIDELSSEGSSSSEQAQPKKRGRLVQNKAGDHTQSHEQPPKETTQKKRTGRPPKASSTQLQTSGRPTGMGVLIGDDGHTYLSSSTTTVRLTSSQPCTPNQGTEEVQRQATSSQPSQLEKQN